ncbi:hypothetical protein [Microbacterium plantarum]|uniref:Uncharacterized protein n=1 Tax=Microbacterium plantarum TaxID=1816425 RepID=A0ABV5ENZ1_9MICO
MLAWLITLLGLLVVSAALMVVGVFRSSHGRGGRGGGHFFDRVARPWTIPALVLLAGVIIGCILLFR